MSQGYKTLELDLHLGEWYKERNSAYKSNIRYIKKSPRVTIFPPGTHVKRLSPICKLSPTYRHMIGVQPLSPTCRHGPTYKPKIAPLINVTILQQAASHHIQVPDPQITTVTKQHVEDKAKEICTN